MDSSIDQLATQVAKLEERLSSVEKSSVPPDAIAVPNILIVNEEGVVEEPEYAEIEEEGEEGEEGEPEEGELLEASGKGRRRYRRLPKGEAGQVLKVGADGSLEWGEAGGGGGGPQIYGARFAEDGTHQAGSEGIWGERKERTYGEAVFVYYELNVGFGSVGDNPPVIIATPLVPEEATEKWVRLPLEGEIYPGPVAAMIAGLEPVEFEYEGEQLVSWKFELFMDVAQVTNRTSPSGGGIECPFSIIAIET